MANFKALVVYYSRSGTTTRIAQQIASELNADLEHISEDKGRGGALGYLRSAIQARKMRTPDIHVTRHEPSQYDLVVVGTPVWAWSVSAPIRTYLTQNAAKLRSVAFFCTCEATGAERALNQMEAIVGKAPIAMFASDQRRASEGPARITAFVKEIEARMAQW